MAVFATEAAFASKPAVVGSYYVNQIKDDLPATNMPPSMSCHPDLLEAVMEKLIVNHKFREELGNKAREFVMTNWSAIKVAQHYLMLIDGNFPGEWLYDPRNIRYLHGCGLSDKPVLEEMFVQFVSAGGDS